MLTTCSHVFSSSFLCFQHFRKNYHFCFYAAMFLRSIELTISLWHACADMIITLPVISFSVTCMPVWVGETTIVCLKIFAIFFFYYMLSRVSRPFLVLSLQLFLHTTCFREKYRNVRFIIRPLGFVLVGDRKFLGLDKLLVISHLSGCDNARITHRHTQTLAGIHKHTYTGALIHWYKDAYTYHIWQIHMHT